MNPTPHTLEQIATPRTDKRRAELRGKTIVAQFALLEEHARQLERELTALQTATKQPQGADWAEAAAKEMRTLSYFNWENHDASPTIEQAAAIIRKHAPQGILLPRGVTDMPADAYLPSPEDQEAKQKFVDDQFRQHAPLVANREDSKRIGGHHLCEKGHGWVINGQPCYLCQHARIEELTAKCNEQFLEIGRLKDAFIRPAQPERGQKEGTT